MKRVVWPLGLLLLSGPLLADDKPLVIPQVEGARQGRVIGRAVACGIAQERAAAAIKAGRQRMLAAVGPAFTEDRYLPELDRAIAFETSLPRPSDAACTKAMSEFETFEGRP